MSRVCVSIEWIFSDIVWHFPFVNFKKSLNFFKPNWENACHLRFITKLSHVHWRILIFKRFSNRSACSRIPCCTWRWRLSTFLHYSYNLLKLIANLKYSYETYLWLIWFYAVQKYILLQCFSWLRGCLSS